MLKIQENYIQTMFDSLIKNFATFQKIFKQQHFSSCMLENLI